MSIDSVQCSYICGGMHREHRKWTAVADSYFKHCWLTRLLTDVAFSYVSDASDIITQLILLWRHNCSLQSMSLENTSYLSKLSYFIYIVISNIIMIIRTVHLYHSDWVTAWLQSVSNPTIYYMRSFSISIILGVPHPSFFLDQTSERPSGCCCWCIWRCRLDIGGCRLDVSGATLDERWRRWRGLSRSSAGKSAAISLRPRIRVGRSTPAWSSARLWDRCQPPCDLLSGSEFQQELKKFKIINSINDSV